MLNNKQSISPRVRVIQKLYGNSLNPEAEIEYPKSQYKKFIKDFKIKNMILVSRSRKKIIGLDGYGIKITRQEIIK